MGGGSLLASNPGSILDSAEGDTRIEPDADAAAGVHEPQTTLELAAQRDSNGGGASMV
jgi:hypothetical protein